MQIKHRNACVLVWGQETSKEERGALIAITLTAPFAGVYNNSCEAIPASGSIGMATGSPQQPFEQPFLFCTTILFFFPRSLFLFFFFFFLECVVLFLAHGHVVNLVSEAKDHGSKRAQQYSNAFRFISSRCRQPSFCFYSVHILPLINSSPTPHQLPRQPHSRAYLSSFTIASFRARLHHSPWLDPGFRLACFRLLKGDGGGEDDATAGQGWIHVMRRQGWKNGARSGFDGSRCHPCSRSRQTHFYYFLPTEHDLSLACMTCPPRTDAVPSLQATTETHARGHRILVQALSDRGNIAG